jgi:hypothetical protein
MFGEEVPYLVDEVLVVVIVDIHRVNNQIVQRYITKFKKNEVGRSWLYGFVCVEVLLTFFGEVSDDSIHPQIK